MPKMKLPATHNSSMKISYKFFLIYIGTDTWLANVAHLTMVTVFNIYL
jgi:hypothetical protein